MALTKTNIEVDAWAAVALAAAREGAEVDLSPYYDAGLDITCCLGAAGTAHLGIEVLVQISSASLGDEYWRDLVRYIACIGTAFKCDFADDEAAGQTVLSVANPATGNFDHLFKWIFILNGGTVANSEIAYLIAQSGDAGDTITVQDGITNAQTAADSDVLTCDTATASAVSINTIQLPDWARRCRILYNNGYGATGVTVYTMARLSGITGL